MRFSALLAVLLAAACAQPDILDRAAANPRDSRVSDGKGGMRTPRYGDHALEQAERALTDIPRPWTVERILAAYATASAPERRAHLLRVLAASRDPRGGLALGNALDDEALDVRVAATFGLLDYFLPVLHGGGNMESAMAEAAAWWKENAARLRREAAAKRGG